MFKLKKLSVYGKAYRLNLLDTAGQERFRTLSNSYYRGAHGVILVYDISSRDSFLSMERWYDEAENNAMPGIVTYLVCRFLKDEQRLRTLARILLNSSTTPFHFNANLPQVGSKLDKASSRAVNYEEGETLATKHGSQFCEASAKTRENVRKPFVELVDHIVKSSHLIQAASRQTRGNVLVEGDVSGPSSCSC